MLIDDKDFFNHFDGVEFVDAEPFKTYSLQQIMTRFGRTDDEVRRRYLQTQPEQKETNKWIQWNRYKRFD